MNSVPTEAQRETVIRMSDGNPGAINVMMSLWQKFGWADVEELDRQEYHGSAIWMLFKDECGQDFDATHAKLFADRHVVEPAS